MYAKSFQEMEVDMSEGAREIVRRPIVQRKATYDEGDDLRAGRGKMGFHWDPRSCSKRFLSREVRMWTIFTRCRLGKKISKRRLRGFLTRLMEWNSYCIALK